MPEVQRNALMHGSVLQTLPKKRSVVYCLWRNVSLLTNVL